MLGAWVGRVTATLSKAGLGKIDDAGIERGLRRLGFSEAEVAEVTPIESDIKEDHHV